MNIEGKLRNLGLETITAMNFENVHGPLKQARSSPVDLFCLLQQSTSNYAAPTIIAHGNANLRQVI